MLVKSASGRAPESVRLRQVSRAPVRPGPPMRLRAIPQTFACSRDGGRDPGPSKNVMSHPDDNAFGSIQARVVAHRCVALSTTSASTRRNTPLAGWPVTVRRCRRAEAFLATTRITPVAPRGAEVVKGFWEAGHALAPAGCDIIFLKGPRCPSCVCVLWPGPVCA